MRSWGTGPFENEVADDFGSELDNADPDQRELLLREALRDAVDPDDEPDVEPCLRAVAAAAVVAACCPGAPRIESEGKPEFLALGNLREPAADLPPLAYDALDRVEGPDSGWSAYWRKNDALDEALATLEPIRDTLGLC
jgi:hypothetical protein